MSHGGWFAAGLVFGSASLGAAAQDDSAGAGLNFAALRASSSREGGRHARRAPPACLLELRNHPLELGGELPGLELCECA